ncbi:bifunctional pyridoxamine 5'-phosphate oxidase family protein/GNAT family N-acetyltransferase [Micromonospora sp. NPDC050686]|uniref:bifunctional pyridoxamine 5'-phosphate oxidase family protein/GNAT family N-acetyltransferase n=1 Tax=Micromonospora sp. NPDC050686 TaxID=3154631 RepID=UPI0033E5C1C3
MYPRTERTTATRTRDRMSYDRKAAHAVLDEAYHCALGFVVQGEPRVLPTLHVRIDDTLYLHGSTGSRPLLAARGEAGLPVCVTVTHLDGLVFARSQFHHSANYRSVVAHGTARLVTDEAEKARVLTALVEKVATGRSADSRPPSRRELAETAVLALALREVSVRVRAGGVSEEPADLALPYWAGVVPLRVTAGLPEPDAGVVAPVPAYLRPARSPWLEPVVLRGEHVLLEPLAEAHAEELYAALDDEEVWRYVGGTRPRSVDEMAGDIRSALTAHHRDARVPWVQRCAVTGAVVGTTSYYQPDEDLRTVEIGYTQLGRPWWRSGINTEAKLLLLTRAFEELGAVRVTWQTNVDNERSRRAIERLGATREGTLRANRRRADGTWRESALYSMLAQEWPEAQASLRERLRPAAPVGS